MLVISLAILTGKSVAQDVSSTQSSTPSSTQSSTPSSEELKQLMAINDPALLKKFKTGSTLSGAGAALTLGGLAALVIGSISADKETIKENGRTTVQLSGTGGEIASAGFICALIGTPVWIVGKSMKKSARNDYLKEYGYSAQAPVHPSPYLQLKTSSNSVGLAFVF